MMRRKRIERLNRDLDNILAHSSHREGDEADDYTELLDLAETLARTDFSRASRIRPTLRRRLLNQIEAAPTHVAELPGPLSLIRAIFKPGPKTDRRAIRPPLAHHKRILLTTTIGLLLVAFATLLVPSFRGRIEVTVSRLPLPTRLQESLDTLFKLTDRLLPEGLRLQRDASDFQPFVIADLRWQARGEGGFNAHPALAAGRLYGVDLDGNLFALESDRGQELWRFDLAGLSHTAPAIVDGTVYVGTDEGTFYAVEAETGRERWRFKAGSGITSEAAGANGFIYFGSAAGALYAVDARTGQEAWHFQTGDRVVARPTVAGETVYVGSHDWQLYAIEVSTGQEQWRFKANDWISGAPVVGSNKVYIGSDDEYLYALDRETGREVWRFHAADNVFAAPTLAEGLLYLGSYDGNLYAIDAETGQEIWRFRTGKLIRSSPKVFDGTVYIGSGNGQFYALEAQTGRERWRFAIDSQIYLDPVVFASQVYVVSGKGTLYALTERRQSNPTPHTAPENLAASESPRFQFTPGGWYAQPGDQIRFQGRLVDEADQPINGFVIQADNGSQSILSEPGGPTPWRPGRADGLWELTIPGDPAESGWWWLTIVRYDCPLTGAEFDGSCQAITRLSESILVKIVIPEEGTINADWVCHWDCKPNSN